MSHKGCGCCGCGIFSYDATRHFDDQLTLFVTNYGGEYPLASKEGGKILFDGVSITYTPDPTHSGVDSFGYRVTDNVNPEVSGVIQVFVNTDPLPPSASDGGPYAIDASVSPNFNVDLATLAADYTSLSVVTPPAFGSGMMVGTVYEYTAELDINATEVLQFEASGANGKAYATLTYNITTPAVPPPTATGRDDWLHAQHGGATPVVTSISIERLLENDLGPTPLVLTGFDAATDRGLPLTLNGNFIELTAPVSTGPPYHNGTHLFDYTFEDDLGNPSSATVHVQVIFFFTASDNVVDIELTTPFETAVFFDVDEMVAPTRVVTYTLEHAAYNGMATIHISTGQFSYVPDTGFSGTEYIYYRVTAGGNVNIARIKITVLPKANQPPVANTYYASTPDQTTTIVWPVTDIEDIVNPGYKTEDSDVIEVTVVESPDAAGIWLPANSYLYSDERLPPTGVQIVSYGPVTISGYLKLPSEVDIEIVASGGTPPPGLINLHRAAGNVIEIKADSDTTTFTHEGMSPAALDSISLFHDLTVTNQAVQSIRLEAFDAFVPGDVLPRWDDASGDDRIIYTTTGYELSVRYADEVTSDARAQIHNTSGTDLLIGAFYGNRVLDDLAPKHRQCPDNRFVCRAVGDNHVQQWQLTSGSFRGKAIDPLLVTHKSSAGCQYNQNGAGDATSSVDGIIYQDYEQLERTYHTGVGIPGLFFAKRMSKIGSHVWYPPVQPTLNKLQHTLEITVTTTPDPEVVRLIIDLGWEDIGIYYNGAASGGEWEFVPEDPNSPTLTISLTHVWDGTGTGAPGGTGIGTIISDDPAGDGDQFVGDCSPQGENVDETITYEVMSGASRLKVGRVSTNSEAGKYIFRPVFIGARWEVDVPRWTGASPNLSLNGADAVISYGSSGADPYGFQTGGQPFLLVGMSSALLDVEFTGDLDTLTRLSAIPHGTMRGEITPTPGYACPTSSGAAVTATSTVKTTQSFVKGDFSTLQIELAGSL